MSRSLEASCKRMIDIVVAAIAFFLLSPCFALIILTVYVKMGWPPFFRQIRPGFQGRSFTILKFRNMRDEQDEEGNPLPDEQRLTQLGRFFRATSLDVDGMCEMLLKLEIVRRAMEEQKVRG